MHCSELLFCKNVFVFPPWESIFTNDLERKQDFIEAVVTYNEMVGAYQRLGYTLTEVPKSSVNERVDFILSALSSTKAPSQVMKVL